MHRDIHALPELILHLKWGSFVIVTMKISDDFFQFWLWFFPFFLWWRINKSVVNIAFDQPHFQPLYSSKSNLGCFCLFFRYFSVSLLTAVPLLPPIFFFFKAESEGFKIYKLYLFWTHISPVTLYKYRNFDTVSFWSIKFGSPVWWV